MPLYYNGGMPFKALGRRLINNYVARFVLYAFKVMFLGESSAVFSEFLSMIRYMRYITNFFKIVKNILFIGLPFCQNLLLSF